MCIFYGQYAYGQSLLDAFLIRQSDRTGQLQGPGNVANFVCQLFCTEQNDMYCSKINVMQCNVTFLPPNWCKTRTPLAPVAGGQYPLQLALASGNAYALQL